MLPLELLWVAYGSINETKCNKSKHFPEVQNIFFNQILYCVAMYFRKEIHSIDIGRIDVFVTRIIHLLTLER